MDLGLKGKRVALTGGSKGIGRTIAHGVVFISSPMASRISKTNLVIGGALTIAV